MRIAVSGVNGFVGVHLARELAGHGHEVVGLGLEPVDEAVRDLLVDYVEADLAESWPDVAADAVVHLAALSAVGTSFSEPQRFITGNSAPLTNLCEGLLERSAPCRVVAISSGAVYCPGVALDESAPTAAGSPYALSKLLCELQCEYYRRRGLDIVVMRPFNHVGPGQGPGFLVPDLLTGVRQAVDTRSPLRVGNLDSSRDYTDVRDVVRAYRLAVEAHELGARVLNVCSGHAVSGRAMLAHIVGALPVPMPQIDVDTRRRRPGDPVTISGDNRLIGDVLGWSPQIDLATTITDVVSVAHP